jgi:hypothetical protein
MEIRRQHQPDGDRNQRSLNESKQRPVREGSETTREERVDTGKERAAGARQKHTHNPQESRRQGADSVQISEQARKMAEAETGHVDGADKRAEHQANVAKHLRKQAQRIQGIREDQNSKPSLQAAPSAHAPVEKRAVDPGIADHLRKQAQRIKAIRAENDSKPSLQAAPSAHAPEGKRPVDPGIGDHLRKQAQRIKAIRMDMASETHGDAGRSERVAGLRHQHDAGRLNTPDRIQRAAHRMLGGDS